MKGIRNLPETEELYAQLLLLDIEFTIGSKGEKKAYASNGYGVYKIFCKWPSGSITIWHSHIIKAALANSGDWFIKKGKYI